MNYFYMVMLHYLSKSKEPGRISTDRYHVIIKDFKYIFLIPAWRDVR